MLPLGRSAQDYFTQIKKRCALSSFILCPQSQKMSCDQRHSDFYLYALATGAGVLCMCEYRHKNRDKTENKPRVRLAWWTGGWHMAQFASTQRRFIFREFGKYLPDFQFIQRADFILSNMLVFPLHVNVHVSCWPAEHLNCILTKYLRLSGCWKTLH